MMDDVSLSIRFHRMCEARMIEVVGRSLATDGACEDHAMEFAYRSHDL